MFFPVVFLAIASHSARGAPCAFAPSPHRAPPDAFSGAFYVSLLGNDSWSGTLPTPAPGGGDGPFLTPDAAAAAVQSLPRPLTSDVYVYLRAGTFYLNDTLALGPGSGGDGPAARVRWASYPPDGARSAVLSGGARLTGWVRSAAPGVWVASLPAAAPARSRGLFVNGERRWPARVPTAAGPARSDFASDDSTLHYVASLSGCGVGACWGSTCNATGDKYGFVFNASDPRSPRQGWADVAGMDVLAFGAWTAAWSSVSAVFDANATLLVKEPLNTATPGRWGIGTSCPSGSRFILFNVRHALAAGSGEFYVDDAARTIAYAPTAAEGGDPSALIAVVPVLDTVFSVMGDDCGGPITFLDIANLTLAHATDGGFATRAAAYQATTAALALTSARDVVVAGVEVRATDGSGVMLLDNLVRVTLSRVTITGVGGDGVGTLSNTGESDGSPMNTTIADCVVDGVGHLFYNQPGAIRVKGDPAGTVVVEHNWVRDSSYAGIMVSWQDGETRPVAPFPWRFIVRGNLVEACGNGILSDFGGIYVSTSGEQCQASESCYIPTLVEANLVRDVRGYNYGGEGVYTDENVAGVFIVGNALGNVSGASVYLHCGENHTVKNNIVWGAHQRYKPTFAGAPGLVGSCNNGGVEPRWENVSAVLDTNIFLLTTEGAALFDSGQVFTHEAFSNNVYWAAPPAPATGLAWPPADEAARPWTWRTFAQWQAAGKDEGSAVADPLVKDPAGSDFTLAAGSPALARGFQQLFPAPPGPRAV